MFINEGSRQPKGDDDKKKTWYILVVLADEFRVYKNRLDRTGVEFKLEDGATVTSACFDYNNSVLFLGMSTGYMRFIDLAACLEVDTEEEYQTIQPELRDAFNVAEHATGIPDKNRPLPVTYLQRFEDTEDFETRSVLLLTLADEKCYILSYINPNNDPLLVEVKIDDCGDEEQKGHEKARDIDFGRMQIVRAQCAVNSLRFCLGLVDREVMAQDVSAGEVQKEFSRKNDRKSAMGLFQIDRKTLETKIDKWIVEFPFRKFYCDDNLTMVMFLSRNAKELDFHFLLWDFKTASDEQGMLLTDEEYQALMTIDAGRVPGADGKFEEADSEMEPDPAELAKVE